MAPAGPFRVEKSCRLCPHEANACPETDLTRRIRTPASGAFATRPAQFEHASPPDARKAREAARGLFARLGGDAATLRDLVERAGLSLDDPRLGCLKAAVEGAEGGTVDEDAFCATMSEAEAGLIGRLADGDLAIADFPVFKTRVASLFDYASGVTGGEMRSAIPALARRDPDAFAMGVCSIDGQRFSIGLRQGDEKTDFSLQSVMKAVNYGIALELAGPELYHRHVGREPSGQGYNEITLDERRRPHNPMLNAGAIITCAMIHPTWQVEARHDFVSRIWRAGAGGAEAGFAREVYESEAAGSDRNYALSYFMREHGCFPEGSDLHEALDLYIRCCAIESDVDRLSAMAATLANGGVCPITERHVFSRQTVKHVLSLMLSCGMYDFSGEFAFQVGLPAKSGVSGALMIVVPGVAGFAVYSPRLGPKGNSVRGVEFARRLVEAFPWHVYAPVMVDPDIAGPQSA
jgi:glutaminase